MSLTYAQSYLTSINQQRREKWDRLESLCLSCTFPQLLMATFVVLVSVLGLSPAKHLKSQNHIKRNLEHTLDPKSHIV